MAKQKVRKSNLKQQDQLKWEHLGGAAAICMRIRQYELPELRRFVQLGTFPTSRGFLVPAERVASRVTLFEIAQVYEEPGDFHFSPDFPLLAPRGMRRN